MLKQRKPMRRTAFRREEGPNVGAGDRPMAPLRKLECEPNYSGSTSGVPIEKENAVECEEYRRLVATLPCSHCFVQGYSQAAHADQGKGQGIKTDDRTCYPACGPREGIPGCHWLIGTSGHIPKEERRAMEIEYARRTRARIINLGLWPAGLPAWKDTAA